MAKADNTLPEDLAKKEHVTEDVIPRVVEDAGVRPMTEAELVVETEAGRLFFCYEPKDEGGYNIRVYDASEEGAALLLGLAMQNRAETGISVALDVAANGRKSEYYSLVKGK